MRPEFLDRLTIYNEAAKLDLANAGDGEPQLPDQELLAQLDEVSIEMRQSHHLRAVDEDQAQAVEQQVRALQEQKQAIMVQLKDHLRQLDEPGKHQIGETAGYPTRYENGQLLVSTNNGNAWQPITVGELVTDVEWGVGYNINSAKIPREICKKFLYERAKNRIQSLLNEQILHDELADRFIDTGKEEAYSALLAERHKIPQFGHVVEVMVKNSLAKLAHDYGLDISIELGDVYDDVEFKIDFIIRRTGHSRAVGVQQNSETESLAVQLTINTQEEVLAHKAQQVASSRRSLSRIDKVDDIVLVSVGSSVSAEMLQCYRQWLDQKLPGGPDKLLPLGTQEQIFKLVLQKMYTEDELKQKWAQIAAAKR